MFKMQRIMLDFGHKAMTILFINENIDNHGWPRICQEFDLLLG